MYLLHPDIQHKLEAEASTAERAGALTQKQLEIIHREKWFLLFVPREAGGLEMKLPEALALQEKLAAIDGSLGWTVTLCSGAGWFAGFFDPALSRQILSGKDICIGGSGSANGEAKKQDSGYLITGKWSYATGAPYLTQFTANCRMEDEPDPIPFLFTREEVQIVPTWNMMGLKATASHSFEVADLWVSEERAFRILPEQAHYPATIYQIPFLPFAELTLAVNYCGMAMHFCRLASEKIEKKQLRKGKEAFKQETDELETYRQTFFETARRAQKSVDANQTLTAAELNSITRVSRKLASKSIEAVVALFPFCGMQAANEDAEINRVWRDLMTAGQHSLLFS